MATESKKNDSSFFRHLWCLWLSVTLLLFLGSHGSSAEAGGGFFNPGPGIFSPPVVSGPLPPPSPFGLVFPPYFGGEFSVRPMILTMSQGRISNAQPNVAYPLVSGDLIRDFNMNPSITVVETMLRAQISRLSFRMIFGLKFSDFNGTLALPGPNWVQSEFEYFKYRVGLDFDVLCWGRSRVGVNLDLSPDEPVFTVTDSRVPNNNVTATPPYRVAGGNAFTVGVHAVYNPPLFVWDWSWIFEARMRWPARKDIYLTEYDFSAGLKSPETTRGSVAFRSGYRRILLDFTSGPASFDGAWDGWFGEMVYYY